MTTKEMIEVMTAYENGAKIECKYAGTNEWWLVDWPCWDWKSFIYRIRQPQIAPGHNPDKLTVNQIPPGHRLLDPDEIKKRISLKNQKISKWIRKNQNWNEHYAGCCEDNTYCTPHSREHLAALDNPPKQPLTIEDFPPGFVYWIRHDSWKQNIRTLITYIGNYEIGFNNGNIEYHKLIDNWEYSNDNGLTWKPCYK